MKLEEMYVDFLDLSSEEQVSFITSLREQRKIDFADLDEDGRKARSKSASFKESNDVYFTSNEKDLLKKLGITAKDLRYLTSVKGDENGLN